MFRGLLLAAVVVVTTAAPVVEVREGARIDDAVLHRGLEVRLGDGGRGWHVEVRPTASEGVLHVRLRSPEGRELHRSIVLDEGDLEARSRELASATAFIIESHDEGEPEPSVAAAPGLEPTERPLLGWVALGGRMGLGPVRALDPDVGIGVRGGVWLVRDHVQPIGSIGWSRSARGALVLDALRVGAGAAFGGRVVDRLWLGAGVIPHAAWTRAADRRTVARWRSSTELAALAQVRGRWGLVGLRAGVDLTAPPVRAVGADAALRWGIARFVLGLEVGLVLPPRPK